MFRCMVQGSIPAAFVVQGQGCLEGKASHSHRPFMCQFPCLLPADDPQIGSSAFQNGIFHLWRVFAENTLVGTVSTVIGFGRPGLVHSIAVLFKIRPCLCFGTVLCHLAVLFFPILTCTLCLTILPRCLQGCHLKSCSVAFNFLCKNASLQVALQIDDKDAVPSV